MASNRCAPCGFFWPNTPPFTNCPLCKKRTTFLGLATPMSGEEANQVIFEVGYERREKRRKGLTPEELGKRDALPEIKKIREFHLTVRQIRELPEYEGESSGEIRGPTKPKPRKW